MQKSKVRELKNSLKEAASWVQKGLDSISMYNDALSRLPRLAGYSLNSGGKKVRPFLVKCACLALEGEPEKALSSACAVEMIHTYSLVHDDLPAMDDDELRRGKPTLHIRAGADQALLAGDLLLVEAFGEILKTPLGPSLRARMTGMLAAAAGPGYLVGGQYMDMYHLENAGMKWVRGMILGKTAAMIRVSMELGALTAGADEVLVKRISEIGNRLGLLFQLTDDILDKCGTEEEMGKEVAKDCQQGKRNLVSIMGLDQARIRAEELAESLCRQLLDLTGKWDTVARLAMYLPERRA
ncbi:MAG: hypothetical protein GF388_10835 [Candidatus Aegiribacteria sp.]|nr:hypothetical protein [Candidatus Aegiribacteria sp.]MBD3295505.1 hypothetical protein [Candidatus Fermentibacteria bacterium]